MPRPRPKPKPKKPTKKQTWIKQNKGAGLPLETMEGVYDTYIQRKRKRRTA